MGLLVRIRKRLPYMQRYNFRWSVIIAVSWTVTDLAYWIHYMHLPEIIRNDHTFRYFSHEAVLLRGTLVFFMSGFMGYILVAKMRPGFRDIPLYLNLITKTVVLVAASFLMNFMLHISYSLCILNVPLNDGAHLFFSDSASFYWLLQHSIGWIVLFITTQFILEVYEKYSPGVFWDIFIGKYIQPKVQNRIVMFLDLVDSTPVAEKLGSELYFSFIRDFIYYLSVALLEYDGRIYQYVGDEIVVSWIKNAKNTRKCIQSLIFAQKFLQRSHGYFERRYGVIPTFKAGVHAGEVTVGEIGLIKKDIAISGDTMNTAARIRTACTQLDQKCLISKTVLEGVLIGWETIGMGGIELKGKMEPVEVYALRF